VERSGPLAYLSAQSTIYSRRFSSNSVDKDFRIFDAINKLTVQATDPGRALITGKWTDIGKVKGPILRALASRAPYFHNGSAATLADVIVFYDMHFNIGFTPREKADLIAFLNSL
jgi:cytochrome c peroxidase